MRVCSTTAMATGVIMTQVAVLLIHMDSNAVASMKPSTRRFGLLPTRMMTLSAIRRCRFHFCIATAIRKPPIKRNRISLPYDSVVSPVGRISNRGNRKIGSMAVAGIGTVSAIQKQAIKSATAATRDASTLMPSGNGISNTSANSRGPMTSPTFCRMENENNMSGFYYLT